MPTLRTGLISLAGLTALPLLAAPAFAQPKPPPIEEPRFQLMVLEYFLGSTWPEPKEVGSSWTIDAAVEQRRVIGSQLMNRAETQKMDPALSDLFDAYQKLLERAKTHAEALRRLEKVTFFDKYREICREANDRALQERLDNASRATATGLDLASRPFADPIVGLFGAMAVGFIEEAKTSAKVRANVKAAWTSYYARAKPEYDRKVAAINKQFVGEMAAGCSGLRAKAVPLTDRLATAGGWKSDGLPFRGQVGRLQTQADDPLYLLGHPLPEPEGRQEKIKGHLDRARALIQAADTIPVHKCYNPFRAACYGAAAEEANLASAIRLGQAGLLQVLERDFPREAGDVATRAWTQYFRYEDRGKINARLLHKRVLGFAYAGRLLGAYSYLAQHTEVWSSDPTFYYDAARVCSALAEWGGRRDGRDVLARNNITQQLLLTQSALALKRAVALGFKEFDRAREDADLKKVRSLPAFNQIIPAH
jgi:hypothetical protein